MKLLLALLQCVTEGENLLWAREKLQTGDMMIVTHLLCLLHQLHSKWDHTTKTRKSSIQLWEGRQLWGPSSYKDPRCPVLTVSCTCLDWQLHPESFLRICFPSAASEFDSLWRVIMVSEATLLVIICRGLLLIPAWNSLFISLTGLFVFYFYFYFWYDHGTIWFRISAFAYYRSF